MKSRRFYDAAFEAFGYKRLSEGPEYLAYGTATPEFRVLAEKYSVSA